MSGTGSGLPGSLPSKPLGLDTYAEADRFYSYRRATHLGEADYGRQASLIGLPLKFDLTPSRSGA